MKNVSVEWKWLIAVAAAFFAFTAYFARPPGGVWNSPDEAANAFWSARVAAGESLVLRDVVVGLGRGAVHPRSFAVYGDALVPGSFPGLPLLYGAGSFLTGLPPWIFTPFLTALAGLALFALLRRVFGGRTAFWSALLFFAHPAVIYYSARGLYHNMLFLDLVILAAAAFVVLPRSEILGGGLLGLAAITRTSEAPWVILGALAFVPFMKERRVKRLCMAALGAALPLAAMAAMNAAVYGSPFQTGYAMPEASAASPQPSAVLPFGIHPRLIFLHTFDYIIRLFWWLAIPAAAGLVVILARWRSLASVQKRYAIVAAAVSAWLLVLYGSWQVVDRFNPTDVSIGVSYARYFLPVYVMLLPLASHGLLTMADRAKKPGRLMIEIAVVLAVFSIQAAVFRGDESLVAVRRVQTENAAKRQVLLQSIPEDAAVMTSRFDKIIFPDRHRILPAEDDVSFEVASGLVLAIPVMWYGLEQTPEQLAALQETAARHGLRLEEVGRPIPGEVLYRMRTMRDTVPSP